MKRENSPADHAERVRSVALSRSAAAQSSLAASWARSMKTYGLEPDAPPAREVQLEASELHYRRDALGRILATSAPVMDRLYASLGLTGCSVFLSDTDGVVIDHRMPDGDGAMLRAAGLCKGGVWSEAVQGTNGIGTCIAEERAVTIFRDQHFHDRNTVMSCMGAPVFDEQGALIAVLDVSSSREDLTQPFATLISQTVIDAARQIEADHFQSAFADRRILRGAGDGQKGAVLLAVDGDDLVVGATRAARAIYGLGQDARIAHVPPETSSEIPRRAASASIAPNAGNCAVRSRARTGTWRPQPVRSASAGPRFIAAWTSLGYHATDLPANVSHS